MFDAAPASSSLPLAQSEAYARALAALGLSTARLQFGSGQGHALQQSRMLPVLGQIGLISRGPVWSSEPCPAVLRGGLAEVGFPVVINAEAGAEPLMRGAGLVQVMTPATLALLDLRGGKAAIEARMKGKWRNRLRRGEEAGLTLRVTELPSTRANWVLAAETVQRQTRGYRGLPPGLALAYGQANPGQAHLLEACRDSAPVAGMVFLRHGAQVTYFLGVTTEAGRALHAHCLLLARAAAELSALGCETLDLGLLNTEDTPGLARFKLGSGARAARLGGTWLFTRALSRMLYRRRA